MRRADRLFQIIQILRRSSRPVTAGSIADELEVSKRTVYRDIADLMAQRVPIDGEAGLGYVLDRAYDMPPLMLTADEIEAVVLGAQLVAKLSDPMLANSARDVVSKIASAVPQHLRPYIAEPTVGPRPGSGVADASTTVHQFRLAIRNGQKVRLRYRSDAGEETDRIVWPVILGYADGFCVLIGWCELRQSFRHFRTDRMQEAQVLNEETGVRRVELRRQWEHWREGQLSTRVST